MNHKKLIIANWKSNPASVSAAIKLAKATDFAGVVIVPPFPFLEQINKTIQKAVLGAQDVFWDNLGPYTGEVSWRQLKYLNVEYVIIGHSERRKYLSETDELINKKVKAAIKSGLKVVLCIGEPANIRRQGISKSKAFIKKQLTEDLKSLHTIYDMLRTRLIIAYEPVWAISTEKGSRPDKPEDAAEMISFIKESLYTKYSIRNALVLYGGSVTSRNAKAFLRMPEIDGALVGGASLKPAEFLKIIKSV